MYVGIESFFYLRLSQLIFLIVKNEKISGELNETSTDISLRLFSKTRIRFRVSVKAVLIPWLSDVKYAAKIG